MASAVEKLTPRQLQALRTDKNRITILHRKHDGNGNSDLRPVTSDFSESMARVLSLYCDSQLPGKSKPGAGVDLARPVKPAIIIEGGDYEPLRQTFSWVNDSCGGRSELPALGPLPLSKHFALREAAGFLGVQVLVRKLDGKIMKLAGDQPNLHDVLQVVKDYPPATYHNHRNIVADSLANAQFRGAVKPDSVALQAIRTQDPPFTNMVNSLVIAKGVAMAAEEAKQAADEARMKAEEEARRLAKEQKIKELRAAANKVRRDQAKHKKAELEAKRAEEAEKKRREKIAKTADSSPKRIDISNPASVFLRPKRGGDLAGRGKKTAGEGGDGESLLPKKNTTVDLEIVLPGKSIKIANAGEVKVGGLK